MSSQLVSDKPLTRAGTRPQVLAMPSPTVSRFVLLAAALLSSGLFVGTWIHNRTAVGADWLVRAIECEGLRPEVAPGASVAEELRAQQVVEDCLSSPQQRLAWFAIGGVVLTVVAACVLLAAVPGAIVRRRSLRPAGPKLAAASERVAELAGECGLRRVPQTMVGSSKLRDAFSFGLPGRYAVALPPALAVRSTSAAFDPLVRHELAHLLRRDVLIAWSARALWSVVLTLLALPLVLALARTDLSLVPSYWWRAALLLAATLVASAGILRSREHDADLESARTGARRETLTALLGSSGRRPPSGWRRLVSLHPDPAVRVHILSNPALLARPSAVDAAIASFLAAVTIPLLASVLATAPSLTRWVYVVPAVLVGPMMGATVGLALWRLAVIDVVNGAATMRGAARRVAAGVFAGFLVGQAASLAAVGTGTITGDRTPLPGLIGAVALSGTTFVVAGLGALAADRAGHTSARGYTTAALAASGTLFAFALWGTAQLTSAGDLGGWSLAAHLAVTMHQQAVTAVVVTLAVAVLLLLLIRPGSAPAWAVDGDLLEGAPRGGQLRSVMPALIVGPSAGVPAALAILAFRLTAGPAAGYEQHAQRLEVFVWVFAGAGVAAGLSLLVLHGLRGTGAGLLAAPIASATAALGFVLLNTALGGIPSLELIGEVMLPGLPLGILLLLFGATLASLPLPDRVGHQRLLPLVVVAMLLGGTFAVGAISARDTLSPPLQTVTNGMSAPDYVNSYAPSIETRISGVDAAVAAISADPWLAPHERAQRIRTEIVEPINGLLGEAVSVVPTDGSLVQAHEVLLNALKAAAQAYENSAQVYETGNYSLEVQSRADMAEAQQMFLAWRDDVSTYATP